MTDVLLNQWPITKTNEDDLIQPWMESFIFDRKIQNMAKGTIHFYISKLKLFLDYCEQMNIIYIHQINTNIIRNYLAYLESKGHNPGGIHAGYRTLKTFLIWWGNETELDGWKNPIMKVKAPKMSVEPLEPVSIDIVERLINTCEGSGFLGVRDKALLLVLLDTGARAAEVCAINMEDVDFIAGSVLIRNGKGRKPRTVFLGKKTRRCLRAYIKERRNLKELIDDDALWVKLDGERLQYWGLNQMLRRRASSAHVRKPELHDFRRAFALNYLRNGGDIYTLQKLMGHADLQVLRRYLAQTNEDLQIAHNKFSPVDNSRL